MTESGIYQRLGVTTVINAAGHYTLLGGSVQSDAVRETMTEALRAFVAVPELQRAVGQRLAVLTGAEAAYVTSGASAALYLLTASALHRRGHVPGDSVHGCEVATVPESPNPYDLAIRQAGVPIRVVHEESLGALDRSQTLFVLFTPSRTASLDRLPAIVAAATSAGLPVVVDAAPQVPPVANLRRIPAMGASAIVVSGGKALRGPQGTGLILGEEDTVGPLYDWGFPQRGAGRPFKVGREAMMGLLVAVEEALERDDEAFILGCEQQVAVLTEKLARHPGLSVWRGFPNMAGQPVPFAVVEPRNSDIDLNQLKAHLRAWQPRIEVGDLPPGSDMPDAGVIVNPLTLRDGEIHEIVDALEAWTPPLARAPAMQESGGGGGG